MDECLVHCTNFSSPSDSLRQSEQRPQLATAGEGVEQFELSLPNGTTATVLKRHGLDAFLSECCDLFETYVFTAGVRGYASAVLDRTDVEGKLAGRLYRDDCRPVATPVGPQYLKDLSAVARRSGRRSLDRIVLVDNNPVSFVCQPRNGIPVPDFLGQVDDALPQVLQLLRRLGESSMDVRQVLHPLFGLEQRIAPVRRQLLGPGADSKL